MTALSVPLFKERVGPHRWGAIIVGFTGVLIAVQPGSGVFQIEAFYAIASGVSYAILVLAIRWLGPAEGTLKPVFYYNLGMAVIGSFALPVVLKAMRSYDIATLAFAGHFCITHAFHAVPGRLAGPVRIYGPDLGHFAWILYLVRGPRRPYFVWSRDHCLQWAIYDSPRDP